MDQHGTNGRRQLHQTASSPKTRRFRPFARSQKPYGDVRAQQPCCRIRRTLKTFEEINRFTAKIALSF
jgi:hypothetical protein